MKNLILTNHIQSITIKKGFSNLRINSCKHVPIDASYDIQES